MLYADMHFTQHLQNIQLQQQGLYHATYSKLLELTFHQLVFLKASLP